jgi:hydrogenase maturation factor
MCITVASNVLRTINKVRLGKVRLVICNSKVNIYYVKKKKKDYI